MTKGSKGLRVTGDMIGWEGAASDRAVAAALWATAAGFLSLVGGMAWLVG